MNRKLAVALLALGLAVGVTVVAGATTADTFETDVDFQNAERASNLSISGSGSSATLELDTETGTTTRPADDGSINVGLESGIIVTATSDVAELTVSTSSQTSGATTVYLVDNSTGNTLETSSISNGQATLTTTLSSGSTYRILVDAGGSNYDTGYLTIANLPYTGTHLDITNGWRAGSTYSNLFAIKSIDTTATKTVSDGQYTSQPFSGDDLAEGTVSVDPGSGDMTVAWQQDDDGDGSYQTITSSTVSSAGTTTQSFGGKYDTVRVSVDYNPASSTTAMSLDSASVGFNSRAPTLDNANAAPQGRPFLTGQNVTLSIPVEDPDLGTSQGDTLTATFYINGSQVAQQTVTSNGTVSADVGGIGGTNEWYVEVTDSYGNTEQSQSFQFERPGKLKIYNETSPSQLIDGSTEIEVRFYLDDDTSSAQQVISRTTTDGTVNLAGLPSGESFVAVARADGYENRRVFVRSLGETQEIYLLDSSRDTVRKTYNLQDFSGDFDGEETVLLVQRNIQGNFSTVTGDFFGATDSYSTTLERGVRHRLVLENIVTGDRRVLGSVTPEASTETTLTVNSQSDIDLSDNGPFPRLRPSLGTLAAKPTTLDLAVRPGQTIVTEWNYSVRIVGGQTLASDSGLTGETASPQVNLTGRQNETLRVEVGWTTSTGRTGTNVKTYNIASTYDNPSLLDGLIAFPNLLPTDDDGAAATTMIALLTTVLGAGTVATRYRVSTEGIGLTAVGTLALFSIIGWVSYAVTFAAAVAWTAMVALRRGL